MAVYRRPARAPFVLLVVVLAAITLVTLDVRTGGSGLLGSARQDARAVMDPVEHATHRALQPVGNFLSGAAQYGSLREENQRLRDEVASMQTSQVQSQAAEQEAQAVLAQSHLDFAATLPRVAAQVINRGSANFDTSFEVNRGTTSGLAVGYPVVTVGGLIGTVSTASATHATVTAITDSATTVGVSIPHSPSVGVVSGYGAGSALRVADIPTSTVVYRGEVLSTSGLQGERYPPGIPVGRVLSADTAAGALQQTVTLAPLVDPDQVTVVEVLVWSSQTPAG